MLTACSQHFPNNKALQEAADMIGKFWKNILPGEEAQGNFNVLAFVLVGEYLKHKDPHFLSKFNQQDKSAIKKLDNTKNRFLKGDKKLTKEVFAANKATESKQTCLNARISEKAVLIKERLNERFIMYNRPDLVIK